MLKAMPFLRLETATPIETEKTIGELERRLKERDQEIKAMKEMMTKMQPRARFDDGFTGNEYRFRWNGRGLDQNSIEQLS